MYMNGSTPGGRSAGCRNRDCTCSERCKSRRSLRAVPRCGGRKPSFEIRPAESWRVPASRPVLAIRAVVATLALAADRAAVGRSAAALVAERAVGVALFVVVERAVEAAASVAVGRAAPQAWPVSLRAARTRARSFPKNKKTAAVPVTVRNFMMVDSNRFRTRLCGHVSAASWPASCTQNTHNEQHVQHKKAVWSDSDAAADDSHRKQCFRRRGVCPGSGSSRMAEQVDLPCPQCVRSRRSRRVGRL
jgi:hypothetical protein